MDPEAMLDPTARPGQAEAAEMDAAALRDAQSIADRVATDEAAADAERQRLLHRPLPALQPDAEIGPMLDPDEILHAVRHLALMEASGSQTATGGTLYVTSERMLHVGEARTTGVALRDVEEVGVSLERILLVRLRDDGSVAFEVDQPRLLRVQLAAARAALRGQPEEPAPPSR